MKKSRFGDWRTPKGLPTASAPETEADRTPRGSLLACMTASREQSNRGLELTGRRRFALRAVASCSHTGLRSDLSVDVLPKELHDQLLLCFRRGRARATTAGILSCQQHRGRAAVILAPGVGATFEKSLYGSGATRAHGAVQRGHSALAFGSAPASMRWATVAACAGGFHLREPGMPSTA